MPRRVQLRCQRALSFVDLSKQLSHTFSRCGKYMLRNGRAAKQNLAEVLPTRNMHYLLNEYI